MIYDKVVHLIHAWYECVFAIVTSDVQAISATAVGESTIDVHCWFIHGSDALGCQAVLVSNCSSVDDESTILTRIDMSRSASEKLSLIHNVSCYYRVFAHDIDVNNTLSNLSIEGNIIIMDDTVHLSKNHKPV